MPRIISGNCLHCHSEFKCKNSTGKYCSNQCQQDWQFENVTKPKALRGEITRPTSLRSYLLRENEHRCQTCQQTEWMKEPIPLEVDHIDGNPENNIPGNLRLICPNCHAQTSTAKGKNRGNGRWQRRQRYAEGKSS